MSVLFIAVPAALAFTISAVIAFLWASRSGQLDDLDTPPLRMLHDGVSAVGGHRRQATVTAARSDRNAENSTDPS